MVRSHRLLSNRETALVHRFSFIEAALSAIQSGEVVNGCANILVVRGSNAEPAAYIHQILAVIGGHVIGRVYHYQEDLRPVTMVVRRRCVD
jgi:hypothetical protein